METSQEFLDRLVTNPSESLNAEVKRWIDPNSAQGCAKIAIACMALRNRDGGYLVIGFDDRTLQPDMDGRPDFLTETVHTDLIQSIISKYASIPFEVVVRFGTRSEGRFPVVIVSSGVRVPVASKRQPSMSARRCCPIRTAAFSWTKAWVSHCTGHTHSGLIQTTMPVWNLSAAPLWISSKSGAISIWLRGQCRSS